MAEGSRQTERSVTDWGWLIAVAGVALGFLAVYFQLPATTVGALTYWSAALFVTVVVGLAATLQPVEDALIRFRSSKIRRWLIVSLLGYVLLSAIFAGWDMFNSLVFLLSQLLIFAGAIAEPKRSSSAAT
jgi:multidrug efflux pump subunit AcrA (membrane-fusion protein)